VGGVVGQTGTWWCENHFAKNLGGIWVCLDNNCAQNAALNQIISCGKSYQVCSPNSSTSCSITNGAGQKTCNSAGSGYGSCTATSCSLGYVVSNGQCVMSSAYSDIKTVAASVGGVVGQTGTWWCENHFGKNLGGNWVCLAGSCSSTVSFNQSITCAKKK
jgi:hypothetical protein